MSKIESEIRYKDMAFVLIRENEKLRLLFNKDNNYAIVVDKQGFVLFEIVADCAQNSGFLEDAQEGGNNG